LGNETFWLNVQVPVCWGNVDSILPSCMDFPGKSTYSIFSLLTLLGIGDGPG